MLRVTLIDEDGCYDPADFNDGLLLGLKGVMASAELHFLRARLQGGKLHKAQKGELRFPVWSKYTIGRFSARSRMMYGHHAKQKIDRKSVV